MLWLEGALREHRDEEAMIGSKETLGCWCCPVLWSADKRHHSGHLALDDGGQGIHGLGPAPGVTA